MSPFQPRLARSVLLALAVLAAPGLARPQTAADVPNDAWRSFEERLGSGLALVHDRAGDVEARGRLRVAPRVETNDELDRASRRVIEAAQEIFGVAPDELRETRRLRIADLHVVVHEQLVGGLPVVGSRVELRIERGGALTLLRGRGLAPRGLRRPLVVRSGEARALARLSLPGEDPTTLWAGPARAVARRAPDGLADGAYEVDVFDPARPAAAWVVTIDGADGLPLDVRSAVLEAITGTVDGRGIAAGPQTTGAPAALPLANLFVSGFDASAGLVRITTNGCGDDAVAISADGSRLVWVSDCDGDREVWTAAADGSGMLQLTANADDDHSPVLSTDGATIVFVSDRDGDEELFAVASDGTGLVQLTTNTARDTNPSLTGDGTRVVYQTDADGDDEIATLLVAARVPMQLTFDTTPDVLPVVSLDGTRIAWTSRAEADGEVWTMDPAGGSQTRITFNDAEDVDVAIAPDGSRVAFASSVPAAGAQAGDLSGVTIVSTFVGTRARKGFQLAQHDLFEAASDASELVRLTADSADERAPAYAADGACLAYTTDADGDLEIELLDLTTFDTVRLTDDGSPDGSPSVGASCAVGAWIADDGDREVFVWDVGLGLFASDVTSSTGAYSLAVPDGASPSINARLRGLWARVSDLDPRWNEERASTSAVAPAAAVDLLLNPVGAVEGPTAQVTAYVHANAAHDKLAAVMTRAPLSLVGPLPIDEQLELRANFPSPVPNAFYTVGQNRATFFVGAGLGRPNTAYDTLVLHEAGHFYDDLLGGLALGSTCEAYGALSEAWGDFLATYVSGSPVIGADFFGPGAAIRDYGAFPWTAADGAAGRQYGCEDCATVAGKPEVHDHGEAFAGFAWDLRALAGAVTAEDLLVGAFLANPTDMVAAVEEVFGLSASAAFGGTGDPATSPLYGAICAAAASHGFDCPPRPDFAAYDCPLMLCGADAAEHKVTDTEWLGAVVVSEMSCEPVPVPPENDGVMMPATTWAGDMPIALTVTISVDPMLQGSGRYGAPLPSPQIPERRVYLNAWLFIDDTMGGFTPLKVLGTGSGSGILGPDSFEPGIDAVAFNPDNFAGASTTFGFMITPPAFPEPRPAILRVRLDYGEDVGRLVNCTSDATLAGACGRARYGEVEEYQVLIVPPLR